MRGRLTCMRKGPAPTEWSHLLAAYAWLAAGALRSTALTCCGSGEANLFYQLVEGRRVFR